MRVHEGQCNCGAIAFEVRADLSDVFVCHCSICRRYTGSNGIAVLIAENDRFSWLRGEDNIQAWSKPHADWQSYFCRTCGSAAPGPNDPERMFIPAGLFSSPTDDFRVAHHIWVESRAAWDEIGDAGKQHPEEFRE